MRGRYDMQFKDMDGRKCDVCGKLVLDAPGNLNNQVGFIGVKKIQDINTVVEKDVCSANCLLVLAGQL